jgi:predicted ester cyclase
MRKHAALGLSVIVCSLLVLAWGQQRRTAPLERSGAPGQAKFSPEQHQAVVRRVFDDLFNRGRYEAIPEIYARDCVVHERNKAMRLDDAVAEGKGWRSAAPDVQMTPEQMSVQGDIVTAVWTGRGTHTGRANGLMHPTGKRFLVHGVSRFRMANGKIAEVWNDWDRNELFRQIGVSPTAAYLYDKAEDIRLSFNRVFSSGPSSFYFDR